MSAVSSGRKLTKGEATRRAILIAAEQRFAEFGYDAARLEMIAEDVGIRQAGIFYYFPSKLELFQELTGRIHTDLLAFTQSRLSGATDPWERLMLLTEAWLDFMVARPSAARIILRSCANASSNDLYPETYSSDVLSLLRGIIREGISSGRFTNVDSMYLVNLLSGSILHYVCNAEQLADEHAYRPEDPVEVGTFKSILRKTARAVLEIEGR
ncbi:hypothetical protein MB02_12565 [Croceicoccus estronivorus]|nr:hypothetical protein MB02_12565 [Croceicoccus estronivorus]